MERKIDQEFLEEPGKPGQFSCKSIKNSSKKQSNPQSFKTISIKIKNKTGKTKAKPAEVRFRSISTSPLRANSKKVNNQDRPPTTNLSSPLNVLNPKETKKKQLSKAEKSEKLKARLKKSIYEDPLRQTNSVSEMFTLEKTQKRRKSRSKERDSRRLSVEGINFTDVCRAKQGIALEPKNRDTSKEAKEKPFIQTFDQTKLKKTLKKIQKTDKTDKTKPKKIQDIHNYMREKRRKNHLEKSNKKLQDEIREKERLYALDMLEKKRLPGRSKRKSKTKRIKDRKDLPDTNQLSEPGENKGPRYKLSKSTRRNRRKSNEDQETHNHQVNLKNFITSPISRSSSESVLSSGLRTEREEWINPWEFRNNGSTSEFVEEFKAKMLKSQPRGQKAMKSPESLPGLLKVIQSSDSDSSDFGNLIEKPLQSFQKSNANSNKPSIPPLSLSLLKHESDYESCSEYYEPFVIPKESFEGIKKSGKSEKSKESFNCQKKKSFEDCKKNLPRPPEADYESSNSDTEESEEGESSQYEEDYFESESEKNTMWMIDLQPGFNEKMKKTFPSFKNLDFKNLAKFDETSDEPSRLQDEEEKEAESQLVSMKSPRKHLRILNEGNEKNDEKFSGIKKTDCFKVEKILYGKIEEDIQVLNLVKTEENRNEPGIKLLDEKNISKRPNEYYPNNIHDQKEITSSKLIKKIQNSEESITSEAILTKSTEMTIKTPTSKNSQEKVFDSFWNIPAVTTNPFNQSPDAKASIPESNKSSLKKLENVSDLPKNSPSENLENFETEGKKREKIAPLPTNLQNNEKELQNPEKKSTFNIFPDNLKSVLSKENSKTQKTPTIILDSSGKIPNEQNLATKVLKDLLKTNDILTSNTKTLEKVKDYEKSDKTMKNNKEFEVVNDFNKRPEAQTEVKVPKNLQEKQTNSEDLISKSPRVQPKVQNLKEINEEKFLKDLNDEKSLKDSKKPAQINTKNLIKPTKVQEELAVKPIHDEKYLVSSPSSSDSVFTPLEHPKLAKVKASFIPELQSTKEETKDKKVRDVRNRIEKLQENIEKNDLKREENQKIDFTQLPKDFPSPKTTQKIVEGPEACIKLEESSKDERNSESSPVYYGVLQTSFIIPTDLKSPDLSNSSSSFSMNSPQSDKEKSLNSPSSSEISQKFITKFKEPLTNNKDLKTRPFSSKFLENSGELSSDRSKKFSESTKNLIKTSLKLESGENLLEGKERKSKSFVKGNNLFSLETKIPVICESQQEVSRKDLQGSPDFQNDEKEPIKFSEILHEKRVSTPIFGSKVTLTGISSNEINEFKVNPLITPDRQEIISSEVSENNLGFNNKPKADSSPKQKFTSDLFKSYNPFLDSSSSSDIRISNESSPNLSPKDLLTPKSSKTSSLMPEDLTEELSTIISSEVYAFLRIIPFKDHEKEVDPSLEYMIDYLNVMANELKENEAEVLEAINTPVYQDPMTRLSSLQDITSPILSKFPTLELILPPDLCSELKVKFESLEVPTRQIYLQMLFDCVNEALNYIRPFGVTGIPDPWSNHPRILFGEAELENVFNRILTFMVKWGTCKAGVFHSFESSGDEDKLLSLREEKMSALLCVDVKDEENDWLHYEEEETQSKILTAHAILDTLLEETMHILTSL